MIITLRHTPFAIKNIVGRFDFVLNNTWNIVTVNEFNCMDAR